MERQRTHFGWESPCNSTKRHSPSGEMLCTWICFPSCIYCDSPLCCTVIPVFLHPPQDVVAETGQDVAITCAAQGDPRPTITWVKVRGTALPDQHFNCFGFLKGLKERCYFSSSKPCNAHSCFLLLFFPKR